MPKIDSLTKRWIQNASDERAASRGCRFDGYRADHVCEFFETTLVLYEGERAGQPFSLMEWQRDLLSRLFGWVRFSDFYGREIRRFKQASVWKPKKNGKSPTLAGIGCYLLYCEGEGGQKIYTAAKDGKQARIAHEHAMQMVLQNELLSRISKVHRGTGEIYFPEIHGTYGILAGDNIKGQEGRNASILVDETHVVDERLAKVIRYAGISKAEGLFAEFSTTGDDTESYGKKQQDYGRTVESGEVDDDSFLFHCHEAPLTASDEDLCNDRSLWYAANPALGVILDEAEFAASLTQARTKGVADWRTFKMYRFNHWTESVGAWLSPEDWRKARVSATWQDFAGEPCWVGLDLSKARDTTAAVFVFKEGEADESTFTLVPFFWLPKNEAERIGHKVPYLEWAKSGAIRLIDGKAVDYQVVLSDLVELCGAVDVRTVCFDKHYAENLTQELADECGMERREFPQTMTEFAGPTATFERLLLDGKLKHSGNPVFDWHAKNVAVKTDLNNNKRPVKPKDDDVRKIDGIVAAIMGLAAAIQDSGGGFYEHNELEVG